MDFYFSVMPVSFAWPQGIPQIRFAYFTSVAVYAALFASCFSTLPLSPSSQRQSQS
jgi:hypothetical protein